LGAGFAFFLEVFTSAFLAMTYIGYDLVSMKYAAEYTIYELSEQPSTQQLP
jgi:hypothetical protein